MRTSTGQVTCPEAVRTKNRRHNKKSKVYTSKSWKDKVAEFVKGKSCEWCGSKEKLLAHHPYRDTPDAIYEDLYLSGCVVLCNTCHFMFHRRHKKKCPVCGERWMDLDVDMCYACHLKANPGLAEKIQEREERKEADRKQILKIRADMRKALKKKHPCTHHRIGGKCGISQIGSRCTFSPTKAEKQCGDFKAKGGRS
jgi:hypothetical protein